MRSIYALEVEFYYVTPYSKENPLRATAGRSVATPTTTHARPLTNPGSSTCYCFGYNTWSTAAARASGVMAAK